MSWLIIIHVQHLKNAQWKMILSHSVPIIYGLKKRYVSSRETQQLKESPYDSDDTDCALSLKTWTCALPCHQPVAFLTWMMLKLKLMLAWAFQQNSSQTPFLRVNVTQPFEIEMNKLHDPPLWSC